jgi:alpha(1,3/1,4) fucosyltransferase
MIEILIHMPDFSGGRLFEQARDNCTQPFIWLRERLRKLGYELKTSDGHDPSRAERIIFFDLPVERRRRFSLLQKRQPQRDLLVECLTRGLRDRLALMLIEPPVVHPENWEIERHAPFPVVFTWSDPLVDGKRYLKINEPIPAGIPITPEVPFSQKTLLVAISGNKRSNHHAELYSARRHAFHYFSRAIPDDFHLYGFGWRRWERPRSFRGSINNKWEVLPQYRFGLCYENVSGMDGYVSERIFDCMRSRCIPVYWGAPNVRQYVDSECFIDRTEFSSDDDLLRRLQDMSEIEYQRRIAAIDAYLQSDRFRQFLPDAFANRIISGLKLDSALAAQ